MPRPTQDKISVLFVCTGNICRSPMAEAVFKHLVDEAGLSDRFEIASAGTGDWHVGETPHAGTLRALKHHDIPLIPGKRAQTVRPAMLERADYLIALDSGHVDELNAVGASDGKATRLLDFTPDAPTRDMPDPYYTGDFEEVYRLTLTASRRLLEHIRERMKDEG